MFLCMGGIHLGDEDGFPLQATEVQKAGASVWHS